MKPLKSLVILLTLGLAGCCAHLETRCVANVAQVCNANLQWEQVMDCDRVDPGTWACGVEDDDHTCVQQEGESP